MRTLKRKGGESYRWLHLLHLQHIPLEYVTTNLEFTKIISVLSSLKKPHARMWGSRKRMEKSD